MLVHKYQLGIDNSIWPPNSWSVYHRAVRTNNDVEGWHYRMNAKAKKNSLPFYLLLKLLYREATAVSWQVKLLSEGKIIRSQRKCYRSITVRLEKHWFEFDAGKISAKRLLKLCSRLYSPKV